MYFIFELSDVTPFWGRGLRILREKISKRKFLMSGQIFKYSPPDWAKVLDSVPTEYVSLAALPTITHKLSYDGPGIVIKFSSLPWQPIKLTPGTKY